MNNQATREDKQGNEGVKATRSFNEVIGERVESFYRDKVEKRWNGGFITRGRVPGREDILVNHNDYLGISGRAEIRTAICDAARKSGAGMMMSSVFIGEAGAQYALEQEYASWLNAPRTALCQSGYAANVGLLQSIAGTGTPIYVDMLAHASIWEGVTSANAKPVPFRHNDLEHLERQARRYGPGIIAVDSIYSTAGDTCPLAELVEFAASLGCVLVVDESHSLGVCGSDGSGLVRALGLESRVHFRTASLAKACVGRAGLIACDERFVEYFASEARPAIFSSSLLPHDLAGLRASLGLVRDGTRERARLRSVVKRVREGLNDLSFPVDRDGTQIVPIEAGGETDTLILRDALESGGVFGAVFCAPATAVNRSMVRVSLNAALTDDELTRMLEVFARIREEVGVRRWRSYRQRMRVNETHDVSSEVVPTLISEQTALV